MIDRYMLLRLNPETVVKPDALTLYTVFMGPWNWKQGMANKLASRIESSYAMAARNLTQEEVDAIVTHSSRHVYHQRLAIPAASVVLTAYWANNLHKAGHWSPGDSPLKLFATAQNWARNGGAGFRGTIASALFKSIFIASTTVFGVTFWATFSQTMNILSDPRLKDFREDSRVQNHEEVRKRKEQAESQRMRAKRAGGKTLDSRILLALEGVDYSLGDASFSTSPESDRDPYYSPASPEPVSDTNSDYTTSRKPTQSTSPEVPRKRPTYGSQKTTRETGNEPSSNTDFFGNDDDASPTAPEYRHTNIDGTPAGSAWERVRRQGTASTSQPRQSFPRSTTSESRDSASPTDQGSYEYTRNREKEQAQAEFDKMIESERNVPSDSPPRRQGWWS
ncbi:hypothetical protein NUU61_004194 [Penicillium alfredii]|uniref:Endo-1,3(4)-beta-glucanase n=1 Tax=Penicillium alfredii TaxID=1506179 RepID=A0A9W9KEE6_9EURO|nr:uncharacterized protein NUU61_004194 [Penicillium alfredii]KAJ5101972.1 hypothetical protein NUU61_004194 [Penicillium alfredii]